MTGEASAYAVLRGLGDQLARRATNLAISLVDRDAPPGQALELLEELERAVELWHHATDGITAVEARGDGHHTAQAIAGVRVALGSAATAVTGIGPGRLDGSRLVILTVVAGMLGANESAEAALAAGELEELYFCAPWPNAKPVMLDLARQIRRLDQ